MSYTLFEMPERVALRKAHRCIWCGQTIAIGEKYLDERSVYDGNIQRHRWHPECQAVAQKEYFSGGDEEFSPGENDRPPVQPPPEPNNT